jgi:hypothetical protein
MTTISYCIYMGSSYYFIIKGVSYVY